MKQKNFIKSRKSGFTLIELLVTLSIFAVTTGIVMTKQGSFDNSVLLTNTAYDIAITLRQAQTFGVNIREGEGNTFNPYGVVFNISNESFYKTFNLFEDRDGDNKYSNRSGGYSNASVFSCPDDEDECVNTFKIKRGIKIKSICTGTNSNDCAGVTILNISFKRPNTEAIILGGDIVSKNYAKIVISSPDGTSERKVIVTGVGQIYVENN